MDVNDVGADDDAGGDGLEVGRNEAYGLACDLCDCCCVDAF